MELALVRPQHSCAARYWSPFVTAHSRLLCFTYPCLNGVHVQLSVPDDTAIFITVQKRREGSHSSSECDARLTTALAFKLIPPIPLMLRVNCLLLDDPNSEPICRKAPDLAIEPIESLHERANTILNPSLRIPEFKQLTMTISDNLLEGHIHVLVDTSELGGFSRFHFA